MILNIYMISAVLALVLMIMADNAVSVVYRSTISEKFPDYSASEKEALFWKIKAFSSTLNVLVPIYNTYVAIGTLFIISKNIFKKVSKK